MDEEQIYRKLMYAYNLIVSGYNLLFHGFSLHFQIKIAIKRNCVRRQLYCVRRQSPLFMWDAFSSLVCDLNANKDLLRLTHIN